NTQIDQLRAELEEAKTKNTHIDQLRAEFEEAKTKNTQIDQLRAELEEAKTKNTQIDQLRAELEEAKTKNTQIDQLRAELEEAKTKNTQIDQLRAELEEAKTKSTQIDELRAGLEEAKAKNDAIKLQSNEHFRQEQDKLKQILIELLEQDVRNQLPNDNQDFNEWLSSYRTIFSSSIESTKRVLQDESATLKSENDQLHRNMHEVENQLKEIEQTVQSKEESLLGDLKSKDATLGNVLSENEQLNGELQRLRSEIDRLRIAHDAAVDETRALKLQLEEQSLIISNIPSITGDESLEFINQQSLLLAPEIDSRVDQLNELIRSSKEALENQDSVVQQLDKHLNKMHHSSTGEVRSEDPPKKENYFRILSL
ncbi:unnamed protein product, partial [Rotaria sordida]